MKFLVILNPYANRWRAQSQHELIRNAFDQAGLAYAFAFTIGAGHATQLARNAATNGFSAVVAAGGDGTAHEVVNGLMQAVGADGSSPTLPLGLLPLGNGNDFNDMLGLPRDFEKIARITHERVRVAMFS